MSGRFIAVLKSKCGLFLLASLLAFSGFGAFCGFLALLFAFLIALFIAFLLTFLVASFLAVFVTLLVFFLTAFALLTLLFAFLHGGLCAETQAESGHGGHKHKFLHNLQSFNVVFTDDVVVWRQSDMLSERYPTAAKI